MLLWPHIYDLHIALCLQNTTVKTDFLFRVTELESKVINMDFDAPILLMGRSGTGKTTCCLYRLWTQFLKYWTLARDRAYESWYLSVEYYATVEERGMACFAFTVFVACFMFNVLHKCRTANLVADYSCIVFFENTSKTTGEKGHWSNFSEKKVSIPCNFSVFLTVFALIRSGHLRFLQPSRQNLCEFDFGAMVKQKWLEPPKLHFHVVFLNDLLHSQKTPI